MHFRYNNTQFQYGLLLKVTKDRTNLQGRYVMNHPFDGPMHCPGAQECIADTRKSIKKEGDVLNSLTGWARADIAKHIRQSTPAVYR